MPEKRKSTARDTRQPTKVTLYIDSALLKEFKKVAIDEEKGFSELAQEAFQLYINSHRKSPNQK